LQTLKRKEIEEGGYRRIILDDNQCDDDGIENRDEGLNTAEA
jgi:hypothetical protein